MATCSFILYRAQTRSFTTRYTSTSRAYNWKLTILINLHVHFTKEFSLFIWRFNKYNIIRFIFFKVDSKRQKQVVRVTGVVYLTELHNLSLFSLIIRSLSTTTLNIGHLFQGCQQKPTFIKIINTPGTMMLLSSYCTVFHSRRVHL